MIAFKLNSQLQMGNSNTTTVTTITQKHPTNDYLITSQLYGTYTPCDQQQMIAKRFLVRPEEEAVFMELVGKYRNVQSCHVLTLRQVERFEGKGRGACYQLKFPYYRNTLRHLFQDRRFIPFGETRIVEMINHVSRGLLELEKNDLPTGVICPSKIAVDQQANRFIIAVDMFMNEGDYRMVEQKNEEHSRYLPAACQEVKCLCHQNKIIYSLGVIALRMAKGEDTQKGKTRKDLFYLKNKFSKSFCRLLQGMLAQTCSERPSIDSVQNSSAQLLECPEQAPSGLIPGYNTLGSVFLLKSFLTHPPLLPTPY